MKKFILAIAFLPFFVFGAGDTTKQPASTQRVSNTTLTCPTGKWCRVVVTAKGTYRFNYSNYGSGVYNSVTTGNLTLNNAEIDKEIIIKSGQTVNCTIPTIPSVGVCSLTGQLFSVSSEFTCNVSGTNFAGKKMSMSFVCNDGTSPNINTLFAVDGSYHFYSMEYYN